MLNHTERLVAELDKDPAKVNEQIKLRHERDQYGSPLHEAADDCSADITAMLLDRGAALNALDNKGQTALQSIDAGSVIGGRGAFSRGGPGARSGPALTGIRGKAPLGTCSSRVIRFTMIHLSGARLLSGLAPHG